MVTRYIILADSKNTHPFKTPRQLTKINGETLVGRTVRLLKENGIKDILITAHDKRFDNQGATRYEPLHNDYNPHTLEGYWLNAFPEELLNEPICFMFGDVYYSEDAVKKIVETDTDDLLFFCTYNNHTDKYIKLHDEPLAYKVVDYELFKQKIAEVKELKDEGVCCREPVVWELYRQINGQYINEHKMTKGYVAINDISCDIDTLEDIHKLQIKLGGIELIKVEVIEEFTLERFNEITNIQRRNKDQYGRLYVGDTFECEKELAEYLTGGNALKKVVVKVIEVIPKKEPKIEKPIEKEIEPDVIIEKKTETKPKKKKNSKK